jgi:hypothetical protein
VSFKSTVNDMWWIPIEFERIVYDGRLVRSQPMWYIRMQSYVLVTYEAFPVLLRAPWKLPEGSCPTRVQRIALPGLAPSPCVLLFITLLDIHGLVQPTVPC